MSSIAVQWTQIRSSLSGLLRSPKQLALHLLLLGGLLSLFWLGSRYPALQQKAELASTFSIQSFLSIKPVMTVAEGASYWERVWVSSINWYAANKIGMTFGLLAGTILLSMFQGLRAVQTPYAWLNAVLGLLTGAPLGVCANCAAPIAQGLMQSGNSRSYSLAMMLSSPSFNIVVVTMMLALFSGPMVFWILALKLVFVILVLPLIVGQEQSLKPVETFYESSEEGCKVDFSTSTPHPFSESWIQAIGSTFKSLLTQGWYLFKADPSLNGSGRYFGGFAG